LEFLYDGDPGKNRGASQARKVVISFWQSAEFGAAGGVEPTRTPPILASSSGASRHNGKRGTAEHVLAK
jgi:hypothetical protein